MNKPVLESIVESGKWWRGARRALVIAGAAALLFAGVQASGGDGQAPAATAARPLKVLFLGDGDGTHQSAGLYTSLAPVFARHGIQLTHVPTPDAALTTQVLAD